MKHNEGFASFGRTVFKHSNIQTFKLERQDSGRSKSASTNDNMPYHACQKVKYSDLCADQALFGHPNFPLASRPQLPQLITLLKGQIAIDQ
jgi:hypothetical protein